MTKIWTYLGYNVYPADRNSAGIRWTANLGIGFTLRADTKEEMRKLIHLYRLNKGEMK